MDNERDGGMPAVTDLLDTYTEGHGPSTRDALLADPRCRRELLDALTERAPWDATCATGGGTPWPESKLLLSPGPVRRLLVAREETQ